jgi:hypothetical protein
MESVSSDDVTTQKIVLFFCSVVLWCASWFLQRFRPWSMCRPRVLLPVATVLLVTLQWGHLLEVSVSNQLEDCSARELRCEILCHLVELELQCAKCRSRAPVRFGKRTGGNFRRTRDQNPHKNLQLDAVSQLKDVQRTGGLCCGELLSFLLHNSKIGLRKRLLPRQHRN